MMPDSTDLAALAETARSHPGVRNKAALAEVGATLGGIDWLAGPGDDGAVIPAALAGGRLVVAGEALWPPFVAADPEAAGMAAVLANVNDLAAMGAVPLAIVDTIVGSADMARRVLTGLRQAGELYRVPIVGGHYTPSDGTPSLSAFALGATTSERVLSVRHAAAGQSLVAGCALDGEMRDDFPFFASYDTRGERLGDDVRVLAAVAESGTAVAARDVSMAGFLGSLAMLLECRGLGATVDLEALPRPSRVPLAEWLVCFPAYAFWLCVPPGREDDCLRAFRARGLAAAVTGTVDATGRVAARLGADVVTVFDLNVAGPTGLPAPPARQVGP